MFWTRFGHCWTRLDSVGHVFINFGHGWTRSDTHFLQTVGHARFLGTVGHAGGFALAKLYSVQNTPKTCLKQGKCMPRRGEHHRV